MAAGQQGRSTVWQVLEHLREEDVGAEQSHPRRHSQVVWFGLV